MTLVKVTIKDVPEDCVDNVKELAAVAVDRYYVKENEELDPTIKEASDKSKDDFRVANGMEKKYKLDEL